MESVVSSDLALWLAWKIGTAAAVITAVVCVHVVFLRLRLDWSERRRRAAVARWRPLLLAATAGGSPEIPRLRRAEARHFLELWCHLQESVRGDARQLLNAVAHDAGAVQLMYALHRRRDTGDRLIAINALGHLGEKEDWAALVRDFDDPNAYISLTAARALVRIDGGRAVELILDSPHLRRWADAQIASLLKEAGATAMSPSYLARLQRVPAAELARLLTFAGLSNQTIIEPFIRELLRRPEPSLLIAALKQVHCGRALPDVRRLARHPLWEVRVQAASALGRLGNASDQALLQQMLSDNNWWVRYRAARALLRLPSMNHAGSELVERMLADRYAREMLAQARAERSAYAVH